MAAELKTIRRVYLRRGIADQSMFHTAYMPAPINTASQQGADQALMTLTFIAGVAQDVPEATYDLFAAAGIATKDRPRRQWELDDDAVRP